MSRGEGKVYICPMFENLFIAIKQVLPLFCFVVHPMTTECISSPLRCSLSLPEPRTCSESNWVNGFRVPRYDQWEGEGPSNHVTAIYRHIVQVISDQLVEHPQIAFNGVRARVGGGRGVCCWDLPAQRDLKVVNRVLEQDLKYFSSLWHRSVVLQNKLQQNTEHTTWQDRQIWHFLFSVVSEWQIRFTVSDFHSCNSVAVAVNALKMHNRFWSS